MTLLLCVLMFICSLVGMGWLECVSLSCPIDPSEIPGIPLDIVNGTGAKKGKEGVRKTLQLVQHSTASMGRFVCAAVVYSTN